MVRCGGILPSNDGSGNVSQRSVFKRAENEDFFRKLTKDGGPGTFADRRESHPPRDVLRTNGDTRYSLAVLDLDASPATVTRMNPST